MHQFTSSDPATSNTDDHVADTAGRRTIDPQPGPIGGQDGGTHTVVAASCGYWPTDLNPETTAHTQQLAHRPPDEHDRGPTMDPCVAPAVSALDTFGALAGQANFDYGDPDQVEEIAGDLIANLLHLAHHAGLDAGQLLHRACGYLQEELAQDHRARPNSAPAACRSSASTGLDLHST